MVKKIFNSIRKIRYIFRDSFNLKVETILYLPVIQTKKELSFIVNSIASIISYRDGLAINIAVSDNLLNFNLKKIHISKYQSDCVSGKNLNHINLLNLNFISLIKADIIVVTNKNYIRRLLCFSYKVELLDLKMKNSSVAIFYKTINWRLNSKNKNRENLIRSRDNYLRLLREKNKASRSYVIAGGPSIKKYKEFNFNKKDFVISLNDYVIKDFKFMDHVHIDAICFSDPVLFFGPSKYTQEFYRNLIKAFKYKSFFIFVDIKAYEIFHSMGIFNNYLVGIKAEYLSEFSILNESKMSISLHPSKNSLLAYGCSIAGNFSNSIIMLGADGMIKNNAKKINENYPDSRVDAYRNYNCDLPMLYKTYESSLSQHKVYNKNIKLFIKYADHLDKKVYTLTKSNYEVLDGRVWQEVC